jgi:hypothetical protein
VSCAAIDEDLWWISRLPQVGLEVGSSVGIEITYFAFPRDCEDFITLVDWKAKVPGVVSFEVEPGTRNSTRARLIGESPGETNIFAEFILAGGHMRTARPPDDEVVVVIPASED